MSSSENLLKAALNRISVRYGKHLVKKAKNLSKKAKETPDRLKAEWEILKEEILNEADRLEKNPQKNASQEFQPLTSQGKISAIREKISTLINKVEGEN